MILAVVIVAAEPPICYHICFGDCSGLGSTAGTDVLKLVFLDAATVQGADLSSLHRDGRFALQCFPYTAAADIVSRTIDATAVITNKVPLDRTTLLQLPKLRLICIAATGTNCVDLSAAQELGITVCNVRDYALDSVPQHAMALLLALTNQIVQNQRAIERGEWQLQPIFCLLTHPIQSLAGKTMTIVGYGGLGKATAALAKAFGMQICIAERPDATTIRAGRDAFASALAKADVLSLHCPATPGRSYLLSDAEFALLKPTALLINTARGQLVDPIALIQALSSGRLAGAALDVLVQEPPPQHDPLISAQLPNLLLSPHIAWAADTAMQRLVDQIAENLHAFAAGSPIRCCI